MSARLDQAPPPARLEFDGVVGGYGGVVVVRGVSGTVAPGEVLCVIGRNGVGKSTLMKLLFGQLACRAGSVRFEGLAIERLEASQRRALGISYCPQERPVFDDLSVRDNLTLMRADRGLAAFAPLFARFPILERRLEQHAATLSGGEKKILSFARGLSEGQPLLLLDEPCAGLSPQETAAAIDLIRWASQRRGATIVVIEHDMSLVRELADHVFVLHNGSLIAEGSVAAIQANAAVQAIYVGAEK